MLSVGSQLYMNVTVSSCRGELRMLLKTEIAASAVCAVRLLGGLCSRRGLLLNGFPLLLRLWTRVSAAAVSRSASGVSPSCVSAAGP